MVKYMGRIRHCKRLLAIFISEESIICLLAAGFLSRMPGVPGRKSVKSDEFLQNAGGSLGGNAPGSEYEMSHLGCNPKVVGSNPAPSPNVSRGYRIYCSPFFIRTATGLPAYHPCRMPGSHSGYPLAHLEITSLRQV